MKRRDTRAGVRYATAADRVAADKLHNDWGFSLPKLDAWIEQRGDKHHRQFREYLVRAVATAEAQTVLPWVLFFTTVIDADIVRTVTMPDAAERIRQRLAKRRALAAAARANVKYSDADKVHWRSLHATQYARHRNRSAARLIVAALGLPETAFEAVRKALADDQPADQGATQPKVQREAKKALK